ncbi:MAG: membrane dipeptidase [Candidatus Limnocylindrales bacterium]
MPHEPSARGRSLRYRGERSFGYLEPGTDFRPFVLAPETDRVPAYVVEISEAEEARAWRLLGTHPAISLHDHLEVYPLDLAEADDWVRDAHPFTGYEGLARSGLAAVFENFGDGTATITSKSGWKWSDVIHDIGMRYADWAHQGFAVRAETLAGIRDAFANGQVALIGALEAATPIENELDRLDVLYGLGIRMLGVTYSEANALGSGCRETLDGGLSGFGRRAVERMNRLGILIDVSHAGDRTSLDTIRLSNAPVCISHSGSRELWPISKCKPDEVIRACAERGGVIGIEAAPGTTMVKPDLEEASIETFMRHFEYCVDLVGIDGVTFGPDTFFGDHAGTYGTPQGALLASGDSEYDSVVPEHVVGLENIGDFPNIVRWLVKHGYSDDDIAKVIGGNTLRVLEQAWAR